MTKESKKDAKARTLLRAFSERERHHLEMATVNPQSAELMQVAAPDQYTMLKSYFERRIAEVWKS